MFEHFGGTSESVARFADGDVEDELLDAEFAHGVCALVFAFRLESNISVQSFDDIENVAHDIP